MGNEGNDFNFISNCDFSKLDISRLEDGNASKMFELNKLDASKIMDTSKLLD